MESRKVRRMAGAVAICIALLLCGATLGRLWLAPHPVANSTTSESLSRGDAELAALPAQAPSLLTPEGSDSPTRTSAPTPTAVGTEATPRSVLVLVVDHHGNPMPGARVRIAHPGPWGTWKNLQEAHTDDDGSATFTGFPLELGRFWAEAAPAEVHGRHVPSAKAWTDPDASAASPVEVTLVCPGSATIEGRALQVDGTPLSPALVWLEARDHPGRTQSVRVGTDGRYRAEGLHPGIWEVRIDFPHPRRFVGQGLPFPVEQLAPPGLIQQVDLRCRTKGYFFRGRVVDELGQPVPGVLITAAPAGQREGVYAATYRGRAHTFAETNAQGEYRLGPLPDHVHSVQVGDRHGSHGVTSDAALFEEWPAPFLVDAPKQDRRVTEVNLVRDVIQWRVTPKVSAGYTQRTGRTLDDFTFKTGYCKLTLGTDGHLHFVTARTGKPTWIIARYKELRPGYKGEQRHRLDEPQSTSAEVELRIE